MVYDFILNTFPLKKKIGVYLYIYIYKTKKKKNSVSLNGTLYILYRFEYYIILFLMIYKAI